MNSVYEKEINFGRSWDYPPLGENEVIISSSLADAMDIRVGDSIQVDVNISQLIADVPDSRLEQYLEWSVMSIDYSKGIMQPLLTMK